MTLESPQTRWSKTESFRVTRVGKSRQSLSGDDFGFSVPHPGRINLPGEAGQPNPPNAEFPDTNGNGQIDDPKAVDAHVSSFAPSGTEQDALAEYLAHFHSIKPYALPDTGPLEDQRIQNLGVPGKSDTVFMQDSVHLP
jgi:hypothetical protein